MGIYLICFLLSVFCFSLSVKIGKRTFAYFFLVLSILLPSFLAGCRDDTVGTDLQLYGIDCWNISSDMTGMLELIAYCELSDLEVGYISFNYLIGTITSDIHGFLFFHQLIIASIFYVIAFKERKRTTYTNFIVIFYLLTLYVQSFNLLRQSMAIAFIFLAYYLWFVCKKKYWAMAIALFAMLFHNSIIFISLLPVLNRCIKDTSNKKLYAIAILSTISVFVAFNTLLANLISYGFLSSKYEHYVSQVGYRSHKSDIAFFFLAFVLLLFYEYRMRQSKNYKFIMISTFVSICLLLLGDVTEVANRVAIYYTFPLYFMFCRSNLPKFVATRLYYILVFAMLAVWLYTASIGLSGCVPYTSKILEI